MDRAYSAIDVKELTEDDGKVYIDGMASTPTPDRMNDIVDPMGAKFETPMPLLWQHDHRKPIGHVTFAKANKNGIPFKAEIPKIMETGALKDRVDEAIQSLKYKLVAAVSIGFNPIDGDYEFLDNGGIQFNSWEWIELSLVTIPANPEARISLAKSIDREILSASGLRDIPDYRKQKSAGVAARKPIQLIRST